VRRLTATEKGGIALGVLFIVVGAFNVIHPVAGLVSHPSDTGGYLPSSPEPFELVSTEKARVYGAGAVLLGAGIVSLALYRKRE
jgi:hypothetical protein